MSGLYPNENYIRPPNEAFSVVIRVTKGCPWGRCRFCGVYEALGVRFERRPVAEVLADIDRAVELYGPDERHFFFGDADPIGVPAEEFVTIAEHLCRRFPAKERLTAYGRAATAWRQRHELARLRAAGLDRLHVGLETGDGALEIALLVGQAGEVQAELLDLVLLARDLVLVLLAARGEQHDGREPDNRQR